MIQKANSTVTVDLSALRQNIQYFDTLLSGNSQIMAVVKADAYGHGAVKVAEFIEPEVAAFAVNDIREGIELRERGISKPVLVFAVPEPSFSSQYRIHNLTATISAEEHFNRLPRGTAYHLNFDTGMGRLGFSPEKAGEVAKFVEENEDLFCTGIYSHFATSSEPGSPKVKRQHEKFEQLCTHFPDDLIVHIANTGGTTFYDTGNFDLVRLGIGLYGYSPGSTPIEGIRPVLEWESRIVQVKTVEAGQTVSYGANWRASEKGRLGIIPVGYDDGLRRKLSGQFSVQLKGKSYEVVGDITMNYCMVFLGSDSCEAGQKVRLLYEGQDAADWARKLDTIPYEILTSINPRIVRTYRP